MKVCIVTRTRVTNVAPKRRKQDILETTVQRASIFSNLKYKWQHRYDGHKVFEGNFLQYLKQQFTGWQRQAIVGLGIFLGIQVHSYIMAFIAGGFNWQSLVITLSIMVAGTCTTAMAQGRTINGFIGAISVFGLGMLALLAHNYGGVADQGCFLLFIDIPLMVMWRSWGEDLQSNVKTLNARGWLIVAAGIALLSVASWQFNVAVGVHDTTTVFGVTMAKALFDGITLGFGGIASLLCFLRYRDTFILWFILDFFNITVDILTIIHAKDEVVRAGATQALFLHLFFTYTALTGIVNWTVLNYKQKKALALAK